MSGSTDFYICTTVSLQIIKLLHFGSATKNVWHKLCIRGWLTDYRMFIRASTWFTFIVKKWAKLLKIKQIIEILLNSANIHIFQFVLWGEKFAELTKVGSTRNRKIKYLIFISKIFMNSAKKSGAFRQIMHIYAIKKSLGPLMRFSG